MKRRGIFAVSLFLPMLALALWLGFRFFGGGVDDVVPGLDSSDPVGVTPAPVAEIPAGFEGFFDWPKRDRVAKVTEYVEDTMLPADVRAFFIASLADRRLGRLERNNMAEALVVQREPVEGLADIFLGIIQDTEETKDFRLYSIQHLAMSLDTAGDPEAARAFLRQLATEGADEDIRTRALLMVDFAEGEGDLVMNSLDEEIGARLGDGSLSVSTRISLYALVGSRGLTEHLEQVRAEARRESPVRRAAIAALGNIGDAGDMDFLREQASSAERGVAMAAKGALKRLEARLADR